MLFYMGSIGEGKYGSATWLCCSWEGAVSNLVYHLKKALYGLKQSARARFDKFSTVVLQYGFQRSTSDYSVFTYRSSSGIIIMIVYVDDI